MFGKNMVYLRQITMANAYPLCFKKRYSLPLIVDMDMNTTLNNELPQMQDLFISHVV